MTSIVVQLGEIQGRTKCNHVRYVISLKQVHEDGDRIGPLEPRRRWWILQMRLLWDQEEVEMGWKLSLKGEDNCTKVTTTE